MPIHVGSGLRGSLSSGQNVLFVVRSPEAERLDAGAEAARKAIYAMDAGWDSVPGLSPGT
jgi:hypothetical protein